jgi:hypothetical protein
MLGIYGIHSAYNGGLHYNYMTLINFQDLSLVFKSFNMEAGFGPSLV